MGQGAESCGGYDVDDDPYEDNLSSGNWIQRNGSEIEVSRMNEGHIRKCISMCRGLSRSASFSCDSDKWDAWIEIFEDELSHRASRPKKPAHTVEPVVKKGTPMPVRGSVKTMICHCGTMYTARVADLNRGWGLSCGKRCAAIRRDFGRPAAKEYTA